MLVLLLGACGGSGGTGGRDLDPEDGIREADVDSRMGDLTETAGQDLANDVAEAGELLPETDAEPDIVTPLLPRAFLVEDPSALLTGREAAGRVGDFRIENEHLIAIIGAPNHSRWGPYGGGILDLAPVGEEDFFEEHFSIAGLLRSVRVESIEVTHDGSDGTAVIRIQGRDGPIPLVAAVAPVPPANVEVVVEYILATGSDCLEVRTSMTNSGTQPISVPVGDAVVFSESGRTFGSGAGYDVPKLIQQDGIEFLGSEQQEVSFLLAPFPGRTMMVALLEQELSAVLYDPLELQPGQTGSVSRCFRTASGLSNAVLQQHWKGRNVPLGDVNGQVDIPTSGYDLTSLRLETRQEGQFFGAAKPDETGALRFQLPKGTYAGTLVGQGFQSVERDWSVQSGAATDLTPMVPPAPGRLDVTITDTDQKATPSRITVYQGADTAVDLPRVALAATLSGQRTFFLPAGEYTAQGSRGPEYSYCRGTASLLAGEVSVVSCEIQRELDNAGWVTADLHLHSEWSIDSQMLREERVAALAAEGIQFFASTEHDLFTNYAPVLQELGMDEPMVSSVGNEVSPVGRHFNGLGCSVTPEQLLVYFVVPWVSFTEAGEVGGPLTPPAIWKSMHEEFGCRVVQINHPRDGQGYLDFAGYDRTVGAASTKPGLFDWTFDAMEVWNASNNWNHLSTKTLADWYSFLNQGQRIVATGNSDSHGLTQWAGQPRNRVKGKGALTEDSFYDALLAFKSQVTSAPVIHFQLDDQELGSTITSVPAGTALTASIRVEAASWVPLATVRLMGNGEMLQEWDISAETGMVRLDATAEVNPVVDTWYHVVAFDPVRSLSPLYPGRTSAAFTNPIWVDLDGDGFDAPGLGGQAQ
jgi:hypothetical protein